MGTLIANFVRTTVLLPAFFCVGCGPRQVPLSDKAQARQVAEKVLDAWKSGSSMEEMKSLSPPIIVSEDLWRKQSSLNSYQFISDGEMLGPNVRFSIQLTCTDSEGKEIDRTFNYLVTTTPAITFFREEN